MDFLILLAIISALANSVNKSNEAKKKHAEKQQKRPVQHMPEEKSFNWMEWLEEGASEILEEMEQPLKEKPKATKAKKQEKKVQPKAKQSAKTKEPKKAVPTLFEQVENKSTANKKKKTEVIREQSRDMQPVKPSVQPLKTIYENTEKCEHRIELNPNIQYQAQQQQRKTGRKQIVVQCQQPEDIVQGVIWAEILGKPKALQNMQRR